MLISPCGVIKYIPASGRIEVKCLRAVLSEKRTGRIIEPQELVIYRCTSSIAISD